MALTGTHQVGDGQHVEDHNAIDNALTTINTTLTTLGNTVAAKVSASDSRLTDARTPTNGSVVDASVSSSAAIAQSKISGLVTALAGKAPASGPFSPSLTGATATVRFVGGTVSGAPNSGTFAPGDYVVSQNGKVYVCTTAGTPGTWVDTAGSNVGASVGSATPLVIGTAAVGTSINASREDHVHPQQAAVTPTGLTGATTATRYAGGVTSSAPASGTFATGDYVVAQSGTIFICTAGGSPGTWVSTPSLSNTTPQALGSATSGSSSSAARSDHVHALPSLATLGAAPVGGPFSPTITGAATATRYVGGTTSGAPTTGTFITGDYIISQNGHIWICTAGGTPGTWVDASGTGGSGGAVVGTTTPSPIGTAAAGSSAEASRADHVHAQQAAVQPTGITGTSTAARFVGSSAGAPSTGTFIAGDYVIDPGGFLRICITGGTPGTWVSIAPLSFLTPAAIGTAATGTSGTTARGDHVHPQQAAVAPTGITGTSNGSRFVGSTASGAPSSGTFAVGDFAVAQNGHIWICTTAGTPGTWVDSGAYGAGGGGASVGSATPLAIGTAAAGTSTNAAPRRSRSPSTGCCHSCWPNWCCNSDSVCGWDNYRSTFDGHLCSG